MYGTAEITGFDVAKTVIPLVNKVRLQGTVFGRLAADSACEARSGVSDRETLKVKACSPESPAISSESTEVLARCLRAAGRKAIDGKAGVRAAQLHEIRWLVEPLKRSGPPRRLAW